MTIGQKHLTEHYERWRIKEPSEFKEGTFRTRSIDRSGRSKLIAGELKDSTSTQAILIGRNEPKRVKAKFRKVAKKLIKINKEIKVKTYMRNGWPVRQHNRARGVKQ